MARFEFMILRKCGISHFAYSALNYFFRICERQCLFCSGFAKHYVGSVLLNKVIPMKSIFAKIVLGSVTSQIIEQQHHFFFFALSFPSIDDKCSNVYKLTIEMKKKNQLFVPPTSRNVILFLR